MLKTLFTPFAQQKQTSTQSMATMIVTSHDINFMMGFIKEEEIFNADDAPITTLISSKIPNVRFSQLYVACVNRKLVFE